MKIERFFYGMVDGKIVLLETSEVSKILSDDNFRFLRKLTPQDEHEWWLATEQIVALSRIETVQDGNGRTWVQNQTFLIPIHDYIKKTHSVFEGYFEPVLKKVPTQFEPLKVNV